MLVNAHTAIYYLVLYQVVARYLSDAIGFAQVFAFFANSYAKAFYTTTSKHARVNATDKF